MPIQIGKEPDHDFGAPLGLLSDCHRRIEHFLAVLVALVDRGDQLNEGGRRDLEGALDYFAKSAPLHTADEEESLFPRLRQSTDETALRALTTMDRLERDHQEAAGHHAAVDRLGRAWLSRPLEAAERSSMRSHLKRLQELYSAHIAVEDRDLFPAAARVLGEAELDAVGREMAARRRARSQT
jgi:hemerythrin-like domain-containing protein